jgi:hypothetical protein
MSIRTTFLALAVTLALAAPAVAATKHGVTPIAPKANSSVPTGQSPTFRFRAKGGGTAWVHVCASRKRDSDGVICHEADIGQAKRSKGVYKLKPKFFDFPEFWLNTPGTYYWQAHRIKCERGNLRDCRQEGPIVKFTVAPAG